MAIPRSEPRPRRIIIDNPAAGADWSITPTHGGLWLVRSVVATLATSAVAGNRTPRLRASDGTNVWFITIPGGVQAPSTTVDYGAFPGSPASSPGGLTALYAWPTDGLRLPVGHSLASSTVTIDAGDQWSAIAIEVLEFPSVGPAHPTPGPSTMELTEGTY